MAGGSVIRASPPAARARWRTGARPSALGPPTRPPPPSWSRTARSRDRKLLVTAAEPGPPGWLRDLAAAAAVMEVPPVARPPASGGRRSAVLVLFGDGVRGPDLLYIQRNAGLRHHAGQPAFPGGKIEDGDDGPVAAAVREAVEETGLDPAGVDVLAVMPELYVMASQNRVIPVLAWWREPSAVRPADIGEVALVERVSLADLADPANRVMIGYPDGHRGPAFRI